MGCSGHWLVDRDNSRLPLWWYGCINTLPLETGCRTKHLSSGSWGSGTVSDRWTASCRSGVTDRYRSFWLWRRNEQNSWLVSPSWSVCLVWRNISWKKNQMNLIIKLSKLHLITFKTIHHLFLNLKMILNYTTQGYKSWFLPLPWLKKLNWLTRVYVNVRESGWKLHNSHI